MFLEHQASRRRDGPTIPNGIEEPTGTDTDPQRTVPNRTVRRSAAPRPRDVTRLHDGAAVPSG